MWRLPLRTTAALTTAFVGAILASQAQAAADATEPTPFKSVILIIGDGFDDQHVTMGRNYLVGHNGKLTLDTLPVRGAVQVQTVSEDGAPLYVADSANTATTLATGVVTQIGRVGTGPDDADVVTILERAARQGYKTGVVSTSSVTDATPASFVSHVANRGCENPKIILGAERYGTYFPGCTEDASNNGGPGSIAEQIIKAPADVVLGGGLKHFNTPLHGSERTVLDQARAQGLAVATTLDELFNANKDQRLLGLFAEGNLPVRLQGTDGRKAEDPDTSLLNAVDARLGSVTQPEPMACEPNPDFGVTPPLATLTEIALDRLARNNDKGLFLMVESASIDKQSHSRNPCGSIGEIEQLEEALAVALTFAELHPNTLVLVTADHAQAAQIVPEPSLYEQIPVPVYSPGKIARVKTPEGGLMRINYATNNFVSEEHTGANVPLFGNEPARDLLPPFVTQSELHAAMAEYLNLNP